MKKLTLTDLGFQLKDNLLVPQFCECGKWIKLKTPNSNIKYCKDCARVIKAKQDNERYERSKK